MKTFIFTLVFLLTTNLSFSQSVEISSSTFDGIMKWTELPQLFKDTNQIIARNISFLDFKTKRCLYKYHPAFDGRVRIVHDSLNIYSLYESYIMSPLRVVDSSIAYDFDEVLKFKIIIYDSSIVATYDSCVYKDLYKTKLSERKLFKQYKTYKKDSLFTSQDWNKIVAQNKDLKKVFQLVFDFTIMALRGDMRCAHKIYSFGDDFSILYAGMSSACINHCEIIIDHITNKIITNWP